MKTHARVVVIGGGINGCSVLYHLTKLGWTDVVLVEKNELTSGSTWLAAGNVVQWTSSRTASRLHQYSIRLYRDLETETGQSTGWHTTGSLRLATTRDRMDEYRHVLSKDHALGIECYLLSPEEAKEHFPFMETRGLEGVMYHVLDGHCDPAGTTQALAIGARRRGAEIYRFNRVTNLSRTRGGEWKVHTEKGDITCEIVINAAGLWADRVAAMVGLYLPIIPMQHHHILFEDLAEIEGLEGELASLRDPDVPFYLRKEMGSFLVGPYEARCKSWKAHSVPWDWAQSDLPTDLDRIQDYIMKLMERVPILKEAGMKHIQNGPITYTPDIQQLLGPVYGVPHFYSMAGCNFGITQAGGVGKCLAQWIVEGDPGMDLSALDPRRFGDWTSKKYTLAKVHEAYRLQYQESFPDLEREAGRPLRTAPAADMQEAQGAVFGSRYGWERPVWFASPGVEKADLYSFRRNTNYFKQVRAECLAARDRAAVYELSSFAKVEVSGPGAARYLDWLTSARLPRPGRVGYNLLLTPKGLIAEDLTVARLSEDRFYLVAAAASELKVLQHLEHHLPQDGSVRLANVTARYGVLALIGPRSRKILSRLTDSDVSNENFPHLALRDLHAGVSPVRALRMNFAGELGWELHHPMEYQRTLYGDLLDAGRDYGMSPLGMRALLNSLRLEKSYRLAADICGEETALEAGLEGFVHTEKGDFLGREAVLRQKETGVKKRFVTLLVDAGDADAYGDEAIWEAGRVVGRVTSGGWGHRVEKSLALGFVAVRLAVPGTQLEVEILNKRRPAQVVRPSVYDPENRKMRS
ncbi:MAG: FAD-dependent oxidoreductase [Deltaproteobacteria bacterium]|nr:FAD-dependent oxidoreductase [Deltaproteobacteria bacterium]